MQHSDTLTKPLLIGQRISLVSMRGDITPIDPGEKGTVLSCREVFPGYYTVGVKWDNGRVINLATPFDKFEVGALSLEHELCDEYGEWCRANKLPLLSADEQETENLTPEQNKWLKNFIDRWEMWERLQQNKWEAEMALKKRKVA